MPSPFLNARRRRTFSPNTAPIPEIMKRCPVLNPELVNQYLDRKQPVILTGSR